MNSDDDGGSGGAIDGIMMTINGNDGHVDYSHHALICPNYDTAIDFRPSETDDKATQFLISQKLNLFYWLMFWLQEYKEN